MNMHIVLAEVFVKLLLVYINAVVIIIAAAIIMSIIVAVVGSPKNQEI